MNDLDEKDKPVERAWYCLRAQTRREHIAAAAIRNKMMDEVEVFCPRVRYKKPTQRGKIWWVEPLFPGYLLACFDQTFHLRDLLHINGVSGVVRFGKSLPEISSSFVAKLQEEFLEEGAEIEPVLTIEKRLGIGDEVELVEGAFQGLRGQILEVRPAQERALVLLEWMGEERPVSIDIFDLLVRERS